MVVPVSVSSLSTSNVTVVATMTGICSANVSSVAFVSNIKRALYVIFTENFSKMSESNQLDRIFTIKIKSRPEIIRIE